MNVNVESPSALRRKLTIELEPVEIKQELDRAYNELRRGVVLKGFRPGHAPRNLLERFFGDRVRGEVIQKLIKEYTDKALDEQHLRPLLAPEIVTEETDLAKSLRFSATFDLRPELVVRDYAGLKVPRPEVQVTDEQVQKALEELRERHATLKKIDDRTRAQRGDFALVEIEGFVEGKPLEGARTGQRLVELSPERLAHGLDEVLIGAEVGRPAQATRSYPADYAEKELAGKTVEWRVSIRELYRKELPALDDEFAKDLGEVGSLEELRERVRAQLSERAREEADARARQGLLDLIIEHNPVEVPQSLAERERELMESEMAAALMAAGMSREAAVERVRESAEELRARAHKRALSTLIVDAIADQEKVEVSDDELAARIAELVTRAPGRERERLAQHYREEEHREALRAAMRRERTLDMLLARAQSEPQAEAGQSPSDAGA
ncbi:MAG TPA: trigger factor [Candidatus Binataceae bacterium]|jgi:trigger factor|nr:trigger factor [Candidatus Binataceae bacterium]